MYIQRQWKLKYHNILILFLRACRLFSSVDRAKHWVFIFLLESNWRGSVLKFYLGWDDLCLDQPSAPTQLLSFWNLQIFLKSLKSCIWAAGLPFKIVIVYFGFNSESLESKHGVNAGVFVILLCILALSSLISFVKVWGWGWGCESHWANLVLHLGHLRIPVPVSGHHNRLNLSSFLLPAKPL